MKNQPTAIDPIYIDEFNDTVAKAKPFITDTSFSVLFASDAHIEYTGGKKPERPGILRQFNAIKALSRELNVDCIILGGDILHGTNSRENSLKDLALYTEMLKDADAPTYVARGNHDDNGYHNYNNPNKYYDPHYCPIEYIVNQQMWTDILLDPLSRGNAVHDPERSESTYYYVDIEAKKVRLIFLDAYDYPYTSKDGFYSDYTSECWNKVPDHQIKWLCNTALDTLKANWNYVVCSHAPLKDFGTYQNHNEIMAVFSAFNNRRLYKNDRLGIEKDFSTAASCAPMQLFGHTHLTVTKSCRQEKMQLIGVGSAKVSFYHPKTIPELLYYGDYDFAEMPYREADNCTEANIDVIIMDKGLIHKIRFGAGVDQDFDISGYMQY